MSWIKQVSLHGLRAYLTKDDILVGRSAVATGGVGKPGIMIPGSSDYVAVFDDFLTTEFTDTGTARPHAGGVYFAPIVTDTGNVFIHRTGLGVAAGAAGGVGGVIRMGPIAQGTQTPAGTNTSLVSRSAAWKGNQGPGAFPGYLRFGCRVKCPGNADSVWNAGSIFAGFADTGVLGAGTFPIYDTGASDTGGIAAVADAVGFLFGENSTHVGIRGVSALNGATGRKTVTLTTTEPVVNKWQTWELEFTRGISDTGGTVRFYIDGEIKGKIESPIRTLFPLVPYVGIMASDTGAPILDVDWIAACGMRDTGD